MEEPLVIALLVLAAVAVGMAFYQWRIHRLQFPAELRWPKPARRRGHRK